MFKTSIFALAPLLASSAANAVVLDCAPHVFVGGPGHNEVVSTRVTRADNGDWSVVHTIVNGQVVTRGLQYTMTDDPVNARRTGVVAMWGGPLARNPNLYMFGRIWSANGTQHYSERLYDRAHNNKVVMEVDAVCHPSSYTTFVQSPPPSATPSPPFSPPTGGSETVKMVSDGGTFKVPVTINGQLTLKFVVDSGAADVSVPADVVLTLLRTETITDADFLDKQTYQLADGSTVPSQRFVIRTLKIGDKTLENVVGSIAPVAGSLLLGQSFLSRFKSWSIDNQSRALILN